MPAATKPVLASDLKNVLVVQDDADVTRAWASALRSAGFTPFIVKSVEQLWKALESERGWRALVVDLGFLDWKDTEFLDTLRAKGHVIPILMTAWDAGLARSESAVAYPLLSFRLAPLHPRDLIAAVRALPVPETKGASQKTGTRRMKGGHASKAPAVHPAVAAAEARARAAEERAAAAEAALNEHLALEMERAREIQARLLPEKMPTPPGYEIAARYQPAAKVGGDYYDVVELPDGRVAVVVADVSGKGISSAMVMVMARTVFHAVAPAAEDAKSMVVQAAERISRALPGGVFVSLAAAILDPALGRISVVNAGHLPPKHWSVTDGMPLVSDLDVSGGAIGLVKGASFERALKDFTIQLQQDEHVVFYTDGVNEAMDERHEEFGDKNLRVAIRRSGGHTAEDMAGGIMDAVLRHRGTAPASDDLTILVVRRIW